MIITITSYKGGVGKTTTAIHLACYLQQQRGKTLLIDGDPNRSCLAWDKRGSLPIKVVDERAAPKYIRDFENIVIDTSARPETEELQALADGCDLLVLPTTPDAMSIDALSLIIKALSTVGIENYKVLLTIIPPPPTKDGEEAREILLKGGIPLFKTGIRRLIVFQRAALQGVPVYEMNDKYAPFAWNDYVAVGKELLNEKTNRFQNLSAALKGQNLPEQVLGEEKDTPLSVPLPPKAKSEGKRRDPNYVQVGVYVPKTLHLEVKKLLLEHPSMNMSDLVGQLLQNWVEEQQSDESDKDLTD